MSKEQEALDRIKLDKYFSWDDEDRLNDVKIIQESLDKHENLLEYLVQLKRTHTMSRFVSVNDLNTFRYAIDLVMDYLDENKELDKDD